MAQPKEGIRLDVAGQTDVGCIRKNNEDYFGSDERVGIFVVCDGMGGHAAGEVASQLAVKSVLEFFSSEQPEPGTSLAEHLHDAVAIANRRVYEVSHSDESHHGMGTTLVALALAYPVAHIANVGDSRAYLLRAGHLEQLTNDHSLVMEQVRRGVLTLEEAKRSSVQNIILRALGSEPEVEVELHDLTFQTGDTLLLTTDGLSRHLSDDQIAAILLQGRPSVSAAQSLIDAAKQAGGEDNITCLVLQAK